LCDKAARVGGSTLIRAGPAGEIQRKSRFRARSARFVVKNQAPNQLVSFEIRYSADQWNFFTDQRISTGLTTE
jgi:hypothetical protein